MNDTTWMLYGRIKVLDGEAIWDDEDIKNRLIAEFSVVGEDFTIQHVQFIRALGDRTVEGRA
jgi:hypothetical protein